MWKDIWHVVLSLFQLNFINIIQEYCLIVFMTLATQEIVNFVAQPLEGHSIRVSQEALSVLADDFTGDSL